MQKTEDKKIKKIKEQLLNSPLKEGVQIIYMTNDEVLIEYKGKVYNQDTIKIK
jgi:hypothetical protein